MGDTLPSCKRLNVENPPFLSRWIITIYPRISWESAPETSARCTALFHVLGNSSSPKKPLAVDGAGQGIPERNGSF